MKRIILFLLLFMFISCGLVLNRTKNFIIHKERIFENELPFKIDGVFLSDERAILFYENGLCKTFYHNIHGVFLDSSNDQKTKRLITQNFDGKESFGCFSIKRDTIYIQDFSVNNQSFYHRWVDNKKIAIKNDSTLVFISDYDTYLNYESITDPIELKFYPLLKKPDSTKAWFYNKRWYNDKLHTSRR